MVLTNRTKKGAKFHGSDSPDPNEEVAAVQAEKLKQEVNELKTSIKKVWGHCSSLTPYSQCLAD